MNYRELPVYRKARKLVIGVDRLLTYFPNTPQAWIVSKQLFDAATSIGANIAEGRGRHMGKEVEYITETNVDTPYEALPFPANPYPLTLNPCPLFQQWDRPKQTNRERNT